MVIKNGKNRGEIEEEQGIIQSEETIFDQKRLNNQKASLGTFSIAFHCKYAEIVIYYTRLCQRDLSDLVFCQTQN